VDGVVERGKGGKGRIGRWKREARKSASGRAPAAAPPSDAHRLGRVEATHLTHQPVAFLIARVVHESQSQWHPQHHLAGSDGLRVKVCSSAAAWPRVRNACL